MRKTETYAQWAAQTPLVERARQRVRDTIIRGLAIGKNIDGSSNWIRFPFYHHVFEDERTNFSMQLKYLQNFGEFISLDDAHSLISGQNIINGRYFCLTLDDGLKSCISGALPILSELSIPAVFYIVSAMIGKSFEPENRVAKEVFNFKGRGTTLDFLSWEDCLKLVQAGMTIGSHTVNHARLGDLADNQALDELSVSKSEIEKNIGRPCDHFCAPYGNPKIDFDIAHHGAMARSVGYKTFVTGLRGPTRKNDNPLALKRDQLMANWGLYQLRYFLSLD